MEEKIQEVDFKLSQYREKSCIPKQFVKNVPVTKIVQDAFGESKAETRLQEIELMKGSTLNIQIMSGVFEQNIVGDKFLPMVEVSVNG